MKTEKEYKKKSMVEEEAQDFQDPDHLAKLFLLARQSTTVKKPGSRRMSAFSFKEPLPPMLLKGPSLGSSLM